MATAWLRRQLRQAGFAVETQGFNYPVFELGRADLALAERTIPGLPLWTPQTTPTGGVSGPLTRRGAPGKILVVSLPYNPGASLELPSYDQPLREAAASGAAAVVAITENPVGELMALNAAPMAPPWPVPVLLVAGREGPGLLRAADAGAASTVRLEGRTRDQVAHNVIGRRSGPGKVVVLSTPKSGWMRCGGERGAGMAIWLGLARWLAAETSHNLLVTANTGHEFHGYGGHLFSQARAPKPEDTGFWLHIGANVAAYDFALQDGVLARLPGPPARRGAACSGSLAPAVGKAFAGQPGYSTPTDIDVDRAPGEVALYQRLGYRPILGLVGAHPLHHTPRDLADVTGPAMLEPVARGLQNLLRTALEHL